MKKYLSLLLALCLTLSLAACGSGSGSSTPAPADTAEPTGQGVSGYKIAIVQQLDHASLDEIRQAVEAELDAKAAELGIAIDYTEFNGQNDQSLLNQIGAQVAGEGYDAVIPIATLAAQCMVNATEDLGTPIIYAAISDPATAGLTGIDRVTGTSDALNTAFILDMMFAQDPDIQTVGLLYSPSEPNSETPIAEAKEEALHAGEQKVALTKNQELITYFSFVLAVVGMILQSKIGDAGYAITGLAVGIILISGVMDFNEIRNSISAPIILMSAGVIGIADALGNTGLTSLVGETVAKMLGTNVNPFVLIFAFCILTSVLATLTGSTIGTVYVFAPMAIATCVNLGLDPAAAAAIVVSGWCGHFLPIDGMPAMIMGAGDYKITEFWKFTIPQYFIRLLALTVGAVLIFPMK